MNKGKIGRLSLIFRFAVILAGFLSSIFAGLALGKDCQYNAEVGRIQRLFTSALNNTDNFGFENDMMMDLNMEMAMGDNVTSGHVHSNFSTVIKDIVEADAVDNATASNMSMTLPLVQEEWTDSTQMSNAFFNILEERLENGSYADKLWLIQTEFRHYRRPVMVETISFILVVAVTALHLLYLICTSYEARFIGSSGGWSINDNERDGISMVGLIEFADIFYLISGLCYLLGSIILMISALRYRMGADDLEFPFNCAEGYRSYEDEVSVCQDYGAKIFAGILEFAIATICGILTYLFVCLKRDPIPTLNVYGEQDEGDGKLELRVLPPGSASSVDMTDEDEGHSYGSPLIGSFGDTPTGRTQVRVQGLKYSPMTTHY